MSSTCLVASCWTLLLASNAAFAQKPVEVGGPPDIIVHRTNPNNDAPAPTAGGTASLSPIYNHGGQVMVGTVNPYIIWYGNWNQGNGSDTPVGQALVRSFLSNVGGSIYFNINTTYYSILGRVSGAVSKVVATSETTDAYSQGTRLSDAKVQTIVANAISSGRLRSDTNGVYFVLTSSDVAENSGFCTRYCGWHTRATIGGSNIKYSFVGNASRCLNACAAQTISPNGNAGVDAMISVIAHEVEEATTDPNLDAWYDSKGALSENL